MLYKLKDLLAVAQNEMISIVVHQIIRSVIGELCDIVLPVVEKQIKMNDEDCKCIRTTIIIIVPTCALSHTVYLFLFFVLDCKVLSHTDTLFYWELASVWAFLFAIFFATFEAVHTFLCRSFRLQSLVQVKWIEDHFNVAWSCKCVCMYHMMWFCR